MFSGLQGLGSIDEALLQAQRQAGAHDRTVGELSNRLLQLANEETEAYRTLARVRLSAPKDDQLIEHLTAIDSQVRAALKHRVHATREIDAAIAAFENEAQRLRAQRAEAIQRVEVQQKALAAAEEAARRTLAETPAYQRQLQAAEQADLIARNAEEKTQQAEKDRVEKGRPYEADELFQYLWTRGYATSAYAAGAIARMLDRSVARFIGYDRARADFAMLQEIPRRLAEHAGRQREQARVEAETLVAMQQAALNDGEAAQCRAALKDAEAEVDAIDDRIEASDRQAREVYERRALITRGEDATVQAATNVIENALRRRDLRVLRAEAQQTPNDADDAAVRRLQQLEVEQRQLQAEIERAKTDEDSYRRRMAELESIRRDYRQRGYNRGMFDAAGGAMLGSLLGELLGGAISRDAFWGRVEQHHRPWPPSDSFGGGFGGGFGGAGGGSGGSGGDFRTGGGF